ncbi:MAG: hypothetical protein R2774_05720 [Saprospiraceae bacterium]
MQRNVLPLLLLLAMTTVAYIGCGGGHKHQTHEFEAVEGLPVFDVPQDSTFDVNLVGTCSYNGEKYFYLRDKLSKEMMTMGKYVHIFDKVKVGSGSLGNEEDITANFIEVYSDKQVVIAANNTSYRLTCTTTGMKCCYNGPNFTSPPTIVQLGTLDAWFFIVHDHNLASNVGRYVTFTNQSQINDFISEMTPPPCHSLSFNSVPVILTVGGNNYETYPYGTFVID